MNRSFTYLLSILSFFAVTAAQAQVTLKGTVKDPKGAPVSGASVSLENTLDGTTSDTAGKFVLNTSEKGEQVLAVTAIGYEPVSKPVNLDALSGDIAMTMKNVANTLQQVTITAGSFGSADGTQKTVLEPLDIVTTAGSGADPIAAMQMLPGVQRNGTQTGMMVRGGDASEAAIVVDGLVLQNPFFSDAPGVQQRSRFGAFQFKGIAFSSGGYSARYGQAMSSVLEMNTLDMPDESTINLGAHMAGLYASGSKIFNDNTMAVRASANYTNLSPFYGIAKTNFDFYDVPKGGGGSVGYDWKTKSGGLFKIMGNYSENKSGILLPNPFTAGDMMNFAMKNKNAYTQATFKQAFGSKFKWFSAASYSYNNDDSKWGNFPTGSKERRAQVRSELTWYAVSRLNIVAGAEVQHFKVERTFDSMVGGFTETQIAGYAEAEWTPLYWLAFRPGVRVEHSRLLLTTNVSPRFSASIKTGNFSSVSVAGGLFYQNADKQYLLQGYRPGQQMAVHYIANYMYAKNDRTLRLEGYYKSYHELVKEQVSNYDPNSYRFIQGLVNNTGDGYAQGLELFWRDKKTVKNFEYWLSYSYINTKRLYKNFPAEATPDFISDHNLSLVTKYWIEKWSTMVSGTYSYASGKPYYNPANPVFLGDRTPDYHNVALQVSYLRSIGKWFTVFYLSVDNVMNRKNIFGYRYSADGQNRYPVQPAMFRTIFAGVNISLSKFDKDEL
ncbi:TonB-dependent receptor [Taibaiella chishuiensis]|uniref:TonB-dependent receptor-like protein n=1 Tax=Taibaiella chishuiensis TaxID=1434707 RepID=A0A2P8D9U3_9BACT|nr:TonB-dependent receptor [Taibaiella chishuiensis]PSK93985.1 TonB-dependent receptor-like protein [Taibaiella chishuiensis]